MPVHLENLTVKGIGDGVVTLSFNANANPTVLIRRVVANTSTTVTLQTPNSNVAYTDGGVNKLINGAEYRYQVAGLTTRLISGSQQLHTTRFTPAAAAIPMRTPTITLIHRSADRISIGWAPVAGAGALHPGAPRSAVVLTRVSTLCCSPPRCIMKIPTSFPTASIPIACAR